MESFKNLLDLSDNLKTHNLQDPTNKKVHLTMKDELNGKVMLECTSLRFKLYNIKFEIGLKQSAKGIQKVVKKTLHQDLLIEILAEKNNIERSAAQIQSQQHQILMTRKKLPSVHSTTNVFYWKVELNPSLTVITPSPKKVLHNISSLNSQFFESVLIFSSFYRFAQRLHGVRNLDKIDATTTVSPDISPSCKEPAKSEQDTVALVSTSSASFSKASSFCFAVLLKILFLITF